VGEVSRGMRVPTSLVVFSGGVTPAPARRARLRSPPWLRSAVAPVHGPGRGFRAPQSS
jgi:hypothetical protein